MKFDENILTYIFIIFVVIISVKIYMDSDAYNLRCVISSVDGNRYCVRDRDKVDVAADHLARATRNMNSLVKHCHQKYSDRDNIKRLYEGYNPQKIYEILPTSQYTAYSENKGEKLAFCIETEKENGRGELIDMNTLTYVAIHELSHIATASVGHNDEFWANFKFLLQEAEKIGIYDPVDYKKKPTRYCGMEIVDNPYYDK